MSIFTDLLGVVGKVTGIGSVSTAAKVVLKAIRGNPKAEQAIRDMELEKMKLEMAENASVRELMGTEVKSEDAFVRRARPAMLWLVFGILTLNFMVVPLINTGVAVFGGTPIVLTYPVLPENVYWLIGSLFSVYTGARSWDKKNKTQS